MSHLVLDLISTLNIHQVNKITGLFILFFVILISCKKKDIIPYYSTIQGTIFNSDDSTRLNDVTVFLTNKTGIVDTIETDNSGSFSFTDLEPDDYFIIAHKPDYSYDTISIILKTGENKDYELYLNHLLPKISVKTENVLFNPNEISQILTIKNVGQATMRLNIVISDIYKYIGFNTTSCNIAVSDSFNLQISINYELLDYGIHQATFNIITLNESKTINVIINKADKPTVLTYPFSDLTSTSVTLNGFVESGGGSLIIQRGFLLSETNPQPELNDTDVNEYIVPGSTGQYSKSVSDLISKTYYYSRAFATNLIGASYGTTYILKTN
jgi:Carboxypeptidase regulatory-like domain